MHYVSIGTLDGTSKYTQNLNAYKVKVRNQVHVFSCEKVTTDSCSVVHICESDKGLVNFTTTTTVLFPVCYCRGEGEFHTAHID